MSRPQLSRPVAAALVAALEEELCRQAGVEDARNSAAGYVFRRMVAALVEGLTLTGIAEVGLTYKQWADLSNLAKEERLRGGRWTEGGALRKPFADWRAGVFGDDDPNTVRGRRVVPQQARAAIVRVSVFTPMLPGLRGGTAGIRCVFQDAIGRAFQVARVRTPGQQLTLDGDVRRALEARRAREVAARHTGQYLDALRANGGRAAKSFARWCSRHNIPTVVAIFLLLGTLTACYFAVRWAWVRYHVRPARVQERYLPIPEDQRPKDDPVSTVPIRSLTGAGAAWAGTIEARSRGPFAVLFTFVPETLPPCIDAKGQQHGVAFTWQFTVGGQTSKPERTLIPQILYRLSAPRVDANIGTALTIGCSDSYSTDVPVSPEAEPIKAHVTFDSQGKPTLTIDAKVPEGQPIPGATFVPVTPPVPSPQGNQPDPNARSR